MKKIVSVIIAMVMLGVLPVSSFAKRLPPPKVEQISKDGIIYNEYGEDSILATDEKTGEQIWKRQIYVVKHIPGLESDVQACFITNIDMRGNNIIITNEERYQYELNINTLEIKVLKGSLVIDRTKNFKETF